jgi:hypothetical protein
VSVTIRSRTGPAPHHWSHWAIPEPNSGCWLWEGQTTYADGRATLIRHINGKRRNIRVARLAWEETRGLIPPGLMVLHRCNVAACVNPDHLYLGTHRDNMRDMARSGVQKGIRRTHCKHGHSLADAYVYVRQNGTHRHCRKCLDLRQRGLL